MIRVVLDDAVDVLAGLTVLTPNVHPRIANWVDYRSADGAAVFRCDVEGEGDYRLRYAYVRWTEAPASVSEFRRFYSEWRKTGLARLAVHPVPLEQVSPGAVVDRGAFAWCLGPRDRIEITLEMLDGRPSLGATRAWAKQKDICT